MYPIILASSSPRRQEILKSLNIPFVVHPSNIDESTFDISDLRKLPEHLAEQKVKAVQKSLPADQEIQWILGADTIVVYENKKYGKPASQEEAAEFFKILQNRTHEVITGIALYNGTKKQISKRTSVCKVSFAKMTDEEIEWYIGTGEWHGVAGGYRIQGLASCFIKSIEGSETGVMGLPIFELYDMLKEQGYSIIE